jgi:hypothetical protein
MTQAYSNVYFLVLLRGVDILACTWIWRDYDITISSMCGLQLRTAKPAWWAKILGNTLNWLQAGHCESAIIADTDRCQQALNILNGNTNP